MKVLANKNNIPEAIVYIEDNLNKLNFDKSEIIKALLLSEEIMVHMIDNSNSDSTFKVEVVKKFKKVQVQLSCKGKKFDLNNSLSLNSISDIEEFDDDIQTSFISNLILKNNSNQFSYRHVRDTNYTSINIQEKGDGKSNSAIKGLILGVIFGIIVKFLIKDASVIEEIQNILTFLSNFFIRGISFVIAPLVFFSIADSISGFSDVKSFGKVGIKVFSMYTITSIISACLAVALCLLLKPGSSSLMPYVVKMFAEVEAEVGETSLSLLTTISQIVPSNIIKPFLESDMLQLIVFAILVGVGAGAIGEYSGQIQNTIKAFSALFNKIASYISKLLPLAVFCFMAQFVFSIDLKIIDKVFVIVFTMLFGYLCMLIVYAMLLAVLGKVSPLKYFKNHKDAMQVAFSSCSSAAAMPSSMECLERAGVSKKIYSFSIPLGATINMDGATISFIVVVIAMANIFGVEMDIGVLFSLAVTTILIAMGVPCVAGGSLAFLMVLLKIVGAPVECIAFIVPINAISEFFDTTINATGDGVVSTIVANSENLLDRSKYYDKK